MTRSEKDDLKELISQLRDLLDSGNKSPPDPGEPYLTELPGFDPDATEDKMDELEERDEEILDRIDNVISTYRTLSISVNGEGTVDGDGSYPQGEEVDVSAVADAGWHFSTWWGPVDDPNDATTTVTHGIEQYIHHGGYLRRTVHRVRAQVRVRARARAQSTSPSTSP